MIGDKLVIFALLIALFGALIKMASYEMATPDLPEPAIKIERDYEVRHQIDKMCIESHLYVILGNGMAPLFDDDKPIKCEMEE